MEISQQNLEALEQLIVSLNNRIDELEGRIGKGNYSNLFIYDKNVKMNGNLNDRDVDVLVGAIDADGHFIDDRLDTQAKEILGEFTFGASGAIKIATDDDNGIWQSPTGILAKKAGVNTFALTVDGDATFGGTLAASALIVGSPASLIETSSLADFPSDANLVGYWNFNEGNGTVANDGSDNANDGTISGAAFAAGIAGTCLDFDGTDDVVNMGNVADLKPTEALSISISFKADTLTNYDTLLLQSDNGGSWASGYGIFWYEDKLYFWINAYGTHRATIALTDTASWHHLYCTYDKANIRIYLDGEEGTSAEYTDSIDYTGVTNFLIGAYSTAGSGSWDGKIDEVRVYSAAGTAKNGYSLYKNPGQGRTLAVSPYRFTSGQIVGKQIDLVSDGATAAYIQTAAIGSGRLKMGSGSVAQQLTHYNASNVALSNITFGAEADGDAKMYHTLKDSEGLNPIYHNWEYSNGYYCTINAQNLGSSTYRWFGYFEGVRMYGELESYTIWPRTDETYDLGKADYAWNGIYYKTLNDVGCLGCFDEGVELLDGRIVSDIEALKSIKVSNEKTVYGVPRFDYSTMPKAVFKPAPIAEEDIYEDDIKEEIYEAEEEGQKFIRLKKDITKILKYKKGDKMGHDAAETTALISIMIGAIKGLDTRIIKLEK